MQCTHILWYLTRLSLLQVIIYWSCLSLHCFFLTSSQSASRSSVPTSTLRTSTLAKTSEATQSEEEGATSSSVILPVGACPFSLFAQLNQVQSDRKLIYPVYCAGRVYFKCISGIHLFCNAQSRVTNITNTYTRDECAGSYSKWTDCYPNDHHNA